MFQRYTDKARRVIFFARYEASSLGSPYIETEHILLGFVREEPGLTSQLLPAITYDQIHAAVKSRTLSLQPPSTSVDLPLSKECKRALAFAAEEADRLADKQIGSEHLLLGLLREENCCAASILQRHGAELSIIRDRVAERRDRATAAANSFVDPRSEHPPLTIHGAPFNRGYVDRQAADLRRFLWTRRKFSAPVIAVRQKDGAISFDLSLAHDPGFKVVEGGWNEVACLICLWRFAEGDDAERGAGYTNGKDWLCNECYTSFVRPDRSAQQP